jgi:uncharacterized membrane protein YdjX (TVP38/TMEM64 family)
MTPELRAVARPALLLGGLVAGALALHALGRAGGFDPAQLQRAFGSGATSMLAFVAIGAAGCAVGVPRQAIAFAAGYLFGFVPGLAAGWAGMLAGLCISFWYARLVGRDWAARRLPPGLRKVDRFVADNPFSATLTLRLLPVGNNLALNLLAGLSGVAFLPFLGGSAVGYLPQAIVFALLGSGVRVEREIQLVLGVLLFVLSAALGLWLLARHRQARRLAEASGLSGPDP